MKSFGWVFVCTILIGSIMASGARAECFSPSARQVIGQLAVNSNVSNSSLQMIFDMACEDSNYYTKDQSNLMFNSTLNDLNSKYNQTMIQINQTINDTAFAATANYSNWLANKTNDILNYAGLYSNMTALAHDMVVVANQTTVYNSLTSSMDNLSGYQATQLNNFKSEMTTNLAGYARLGDINNLSNVVSQTNQNVDYKLAQMQGSLNLLVYASIGIGALLLIMPWLWKSGKLTKGKDSERDALRRKLEQMGYSGNADQVNVNQLTVPRGEDGTMSRHEIMKDEARVQQKGAVDEIRKAARYALNQGKKQKTREDEAVEEVRKFRSKDELEGNV